jgi:UDPglucose--hexose-1-phosphate uridylyltransferase
VPSREIGEGTLPHRRLNPLTGEWVLVSPQRLSRPWRGQVEPGAILARPAFDPTCYLCPGNRRTSGQMTPPYSETYVFENDYPALTRAPSGAMDTHPPLFVAEAETGTCRVICYSPRHDLSLGEMSESQITSVIRVWREQVEDLGSTFRWVQIFENRGEMMGTSCPHPHGQVWAGSVLPSVAAREDEAQRDYVARHGAPLLLDYALREGSQKVRTVLGNAHWIAVVPFWAIWPFELLLLPLQPRSSLADLTPPEEQALAQLLKRVLVRYDNLFQCPFPYTMGWHGGPGTGRGSPHWQLHLHLYPPLLRSATVRKFLVGYEMFAEPQRDLTPEDAAETLRGLLDTHYAHPNSPAGSASA